MVNWRDVRQRYLQLASWERPARIEGLYDYDIESANLWLRGADWLRLDVTGWLIGGWVLLCQCVAAWLVWSIWTTYSFNWADVLLFIGVLWLVQLGWAVAGVRADAWVHGGRAPDWPLRLISAWIALLPFALLPGMVIGAACWWLFPVRLHLRVWGASRGNPGLMLIGRFVQYHIVWMLTSRASLTMDSGAKFVIDCRSAVFDGLQADLLRYLAPVVWLLTGGVVGMMAELLMGWAGLQTVMLYGGMVVAWAGCGAWATLMNIGAQARLGQEWVTGTHQAEAELPPASAGRVRQYQFLSVFWTGMFVCVGYALWVVVSGESVLEALPVLRYLR